MNVKELYNNNVLEQMAFEDDYGRKVSFHKSGDLWYPVFGDEFFCGSLAGEIEKWMCFLWGCSVKLKRRLNEN